MMKCAGFAFLYVQMTCTPVHTPPADTFCKIYRPITFEKSTPLKTRQRIMIANRKYVALCVSKKK
jgi:hypothetical protein